MFTWERGAIACVPRSFERMGATHAVCQLQQKEVKGEMMCNKLYFAQNLPLHVENYFPFKSPSPAADTEKFS